MFVLIFFLCARAVSFPSITFRFNRTVLRLVQIYSVKMDTKFNKTNNYLFERLNKATFQNVLMALLHEPNQATHMLSEEADLLLHTHAHTLAVGDH